MASYELKGDGGKGVLALSGDLGIQNAGVLLGALKEAVDKYEAFDLDMSAVEGGDLTTLQLLRSAEKSMIAKGSSIGLVGSAPKAILELADLAGFRHEGEGQCFWTREA